ncbi:MAG: hypothetical protein ACXVYV_06645 [Gaiellales bacterium]
MATTAERPVRIHRLLVTLSWRRYLSAVRACPHESYEEVEQRAWARLQDELGRLRGPHD